MLDFPATALALWALSDACGVRPEYLLPIMALESAGYQVGVQNYAGADHWGLIQVSGSWLKARGIDPASLGDKPASWQIENVVQPFVCAQVQAFGPLQSGIRVYQSLFLPATLSKALAQQAGVGYAPNLTDVMIRAGSPAYDGNSGFDLTKKGFITPGDLGETLRTRVLTPGAASYDAVMAAYGSTYELRPSEKPKNAIYGEDFAVGEPAGAAVTSQKLQDWAAVFGIVGGLVLTFGALREWQAHEHGHARTLGKGSPA